MYIVFFLETVQTILSGADLYYWFAAGFGNPDHLFSSFLSFLDVPMMGSLVALIVQFFFVYRIWVLSEKRGRWRYICIMICLVNSFSKYRNGLIILLVALLFWCIWSVLGRYRCESPPLHITHMSQSRQSYFSGGFIKGPPQIFELVKPSKDSMDCL